MKKILNTKAGLRRFSFRLFLFLFLLNAYSAFSQTKSNLEMFFAQIDSVGMEIKNNIADKNSTLKINYRSSTEYSILENRLASYLIKNGFKLTQDAGSQLNLDFIITEAIVRYNDSFRDGLFGDILAERDILLKGNFLISDNNFLRDFSFFYRDTVKFEQLNEIENRAYPFTQNNHPSEPFFSSLIEPVIAVGAAATAVILFFTIRSK